MEIPPHVNNQVPHGQTEVKAQ
jgi:hypothetical protein